MTLWLPSRASAGFFGEPELGRFDGLQDSGAVPRGQESFPCPEAESVTVGAHCFTAGPSEVGRGLRVLWKLTPGLLSLIGEDAAWGPEHDDTNVGGAVRPCMRARVGTPRVPEASGDVENASIGRSRQEAPGGKPRHRCPRAPRRGGLLICGCRS